ncbi:MAG TPA: HTTM domain-containing protein [Acidimicrobiales bacterium]
MKVVVRIGRAASEPVSSASAAVFRIAFGVAMVINTALYLPRLVQEYYVDTTFSFPYGSLTFIRALPAPGMHLVYVAMGVTGALIAVGKWYRPAVVSFFVLTTYVFLIDSTFFQNHEYLISLLALLMIFLPLDRRWSLDARAHPYRRSDTIPRGVVWLLRFQIGVPYFYGGIAKLNGDWLLRAEPLRTWVGARTDVEPMSSILDNGAVVSTMAYGALLLDLAVVWFLLHPRTRTAAFVVVTAFHLTNAWLFGLFIFPWLMIAATTIFFPPDWPVRLRDRWLADPVRASPTPPPPPRARSRPAPPWLIGTGCALWIAVQVAVPLRHYAISGNPSWTEQGHQFAWHMRLRHKEGNVTFVVTKGPDTWQVHPRDHLGAKQTHRLAGHPERLVHFARHLSDLYDGAEVRAMTSVSLNGRPPQPLVDPAVDLASVSLPWWGAPWILPLTEPPP